MNGKDSIKILKEKIAPEFQSDENAKPAIDMAINSVLAIEKFKDLIFKYRLSAVTMRNQKTYFTEHDVGYCEGILQAFEEVDADIEGLLKTFKLI